MCIHNFVATDIVVSTVALELHNSDMPMYLSISKMAFRAKIHFGISLHSARDFSDRCVPHYGLEMVNMWFGGQMPHLSAPPPTTFRDRIPW